MSRRPRSTALYARSLAEASGPVAQTRLVWLACMVVVAVCWFASANWNLAWAQMETGPDGIEYDYGNTQETTVEYTRRGTARDAEIGTPCAIRGRVMAKDREIPLDYTNIFIEGTQWGTLALRNGQFFLRGIEPGTWTVRASYISYSQGRETVTLAPGDVVEIIFWLEIEAIQQDTYEVRAERSLLIREETGTNRRLSGDQIEALPLDGLEVLTTQPGVVIDNNEIHIRGGRADDTQFMVDGMSVNDPLSGGRYGVNINEDLISEIEVKTGGFSAEYGQAVSGVVQVSTREGGRRFEGRANYETDAYAPFADRQNTDNIRLTLSGPNIFWNPLPLPGEQFFLVSLSSRMSDTFLPTQSLTRRLDSPILPGSFWSPRAQNDWSGLAKLTWKFGPVRKLNLTYNSTQSVSQGFFLPDEGFPRRYQNILYDYNVVTTQSILTQATWNHTSGQNSGYEIILGRQFSRLHSNKNGNDDFSTYVGPEFQVHETPVGSYIAGAHVGGDSDRWHDHYSEAWMGRADYSWVSGGINKFKTGIQYSYTELQLMDLQGDLGRPPPGFLARSQDMFKVHPHVGAAYLQDRIDYKGLILNLGLRLDAWAPGVEVDQVMSNPDDFVFIFQDMADDYKRKTYEAFGLRWKARLSPRVGLSFPVTKNDKFFFSYGHFSQWPRYTYVYPQLTTDFATDLQLLGNPDLDPKVTVQYQAGIQHEFSNLWSAEVVFYSNDIYGYAQSVPLNQITIDPADTPDPDDQVAVTVEPVRYFNADAARSVGLEFSLVKRTTKHLSGSFSFELQRSTGTNSDANAAFVAAQLGQGNANFETEQSIRNLPLRWNQPWKTTLILEYFVDDKNPPKFLGVRLPHSWSANILFRAWAGALYTERLLGPDGNAQSSPDIFGNLGPYRSSLNFKLSKWFDVDERHRMTVYLEVRNLFDHDNYQRVNSWTGQGYHRGNWDGDIASQRANGSQRSVNTVDYVEDFVDPAARTHPRTILVGVNYRW